MAAAGLRLSITDLGLVRSVRIRGRHADVEVAFTEPGCPFSHHVLSAIYEALDDFTDIDSIQVRPSWSPPWTPSDIVPEARERLEEARLRMAKRAPHGSIPMILRGGSVHE